MTTVFWDRFFAKGDPMDTKSRNDSKRNGCEDEIIYHIGYYHDSEIKAMLSSGCNEILYNSISKDEPNNDNAIYNSPNSYDVSYFDQKKWNQTRIYVLKMALHRF